ncbi:MAG: nucleotidyltransferase [Bacteroidia bacterium]|nr:nucleotidyltransferase [Bacteroidia bacterium]
MDNDIRWIQRFDNYSKALQQLRAAVELAEKRDLSDLERQGLVQAFEFTHELAWNVIKDFYEYQGTTGLQGSRDAVRLAFKRGLIDAGDVWMDMIESRNRTSHTYDEKTAQEIMGDVRYIYYPEFRKLHEVLNEYTLAD